ncbi:phage integrase N-terminal SAM-like domain-containing protein [Nodosilinea sp. P-1105]|uniref:phage integrase N-terminal SAM-like domain-containing protein n=1 Tax=Nodosilinea sp. P-1105 TaxID=2546229 RepID=UPI00146C6161|nr:phage integrase N-terminal SAM-like domain-containing protein [Nodosilinea sp. P-1105]NMF86012.1 hypothetical protein [Nodosilinea sp. P-1105]
MRLNHYAYRTEETYVHWIRRYISFPNKCHPKDIGRPEIEAFLTNLAINQQVTASAQNQALSTHVPNRSGWGVRGPLDN